MTGAASSLSVWTRRRRSRSYFHSAGLVAKTCCHISRIVRRACSPDSSYIAIRSEEHTSELQSLMRISYAVFCLKKKKTEHTSKYNLKLIIQQKKYNINRIH